MSPSCAHPVISSTARPGRPFPADLDPCREQLPAAADHAAIRFAAEAGKSPSRQAFRPAFLPEDWSTFASFCVAWRLPAGFRVLIPGATDRTLRFVVEGRLRQERPAWTRPDGARASVLLPGAIVGEDALFDDGPGELDVRAVEDSLVLELSLPRRRELAAAYPGLANALLRAAGAVIAGRLQ